jgi:hypothetical protein
MARPAGGAEKSNLYLAGPDLILRITTTCLSPLLVNSSFF